jgi:hypothetical protein
LSGLFHSGFDSGGIGTDFEYDILSHTVSIDLTQYGWSA